MPGPVFLPASAAYQRYLQDGESGSIALPAYEQTSDGDIIVDPGEVFCRLPGCGNAQVPLFETRYLRSHLRRHGVVVAWTPSGRLSQRTKEAIVSWYESLFAGIEEVKGNDNDQDDQEPNNEQHHALNDGEENAH